MRLAGLVMLADLGSALLRSAVLGESVVVADVVLGSAALPLLRFAHNACASLHLLSFYEVQSAALPELLSVDPKPALSYVFREGHSGSWFAMKSVVRDWVGTGESVFLSLMWQEREAAEMLGFVFRGKFDQRSAFLPSMRFLAPGRKSSPTGGFYEMVLNPRSALAELVRARP